MYENTPKPERERERERERQYFQSLGKQSQSAVLYRDLIRGLIKRDNHQKREIIAKFTEKVRDLRITVLEAMYVQARPYVCTPTYTHTFYVSKPHTCSM